MASPATAVKQQIMVQLQAMQAAGTLKTIYAIDQNANPLSMEPAQGYPFAVVAMPRVSADFEDSRSDMVTYRFDVLFVLKPEELTDESTDVETFVDAVLAQFNQISALTLSGTAVAAVLPVEIEGVPVSTGGTNFITFVATIRARTIFQT